LFLHFILTNFFPVNYSFDILPIEFPSTGQFIHCLVVRLAFSYVHVRLFLQILSSILYPSSRNDGSLPSTFVYNCSPTLTSYFYLPGILNLRLIWDVLCNSYHSKIIFIISSLYIPTFSVFLLCIHILNLDSLLRMFFHRNFVPSKPTPSNYIPSMSFSSSRIEVLESSSTKSFHCLIL
jgi:hypothetical protein